MRSHPIARAAALLAAILSGAAPAVGQIAGPPPRQFPLLVASYAGREIQVYDFGTSAATVVDLYRLPDGSVLFSSVPGVPGYSALRMVYDVSWTGQPSSQPLRGRSELLRLVQRGEARLKSTGLILNLPIVPAGSTLDRDPEQRSLRVGWYDGQPVSYFDFGPARPRFMPARAAAGNSDLDACGSAGAARVNAPSVPGKPGYSDLWEMLSQSSAPGRQSMAPQRVRNCPVVYVDGRPAVRSTPAQPLTESVRVAAQVAPPQPQLTGPITAEPLPPAAPTSAGSSIYPGLSGRTQVLPPRLEAEAAVDGSLDEPAWSQAAMLTGFSQFQPMDGRPADDSTEVLVWYSPHAIYFGIRAFEAHGAVHATLADRDKIGNDDYVQILLDTFNDHRRAAVFGVNPLGVQSDGNLTEGLQAKGGNSISGPSSGSVRDTADLSADYSYQSKGRLVPYGYEVEVRIPFKSIRYQAAEVQTWSVNVVRKVQHSGFEDSWTPAKRADASFLGQSGTLMGLTKLQRGLVLDLNPVVTSKVTGTPAATGWNYDASRPEFGGNVRWGVTTNLTLNGTIKPDFSQVEADAQQVSFTPRNALFYPEKRPFFLEGSETFESPTQLIYTRRVVQPVTAAKLTGKTGGTTVGFLSAVDDKNQSTSGTDNPIYNALRLRHDLGRQSTVGLVYTDKIDGSNFNRVAALDTRILFGKIYAFTLQGAGSSTRTAGVTKQSPMFSALFERAGRGLALRYTFSGFGTDFHAASGFISREDYATLNFSHRFTFFGKPGGLLESITLNSPFSLNWSHYSQLYHGPLGDVKNDNSITFRLRGGWALGAILFPESFKYDPSAYSTYAVERHIGAVIDTVPFVGTNRLTNYDIGLSLQTPKYSKFDAYISVLSGQDENFPEWSSSWIWYVTASANIRPTNKIRITPAYQLQQYLRRDDMTTVSTRKIPRLKIEYQLSRPIFLRLVAQDDIKWQDSLRDDSRTNFPLLIRNAAGVYQRAASTQSNALRFDWLFSYQPNPGTVFFAGYGSSLTETDPLTFRQVTRLGDGFFVKLSYLFKV